MELYLFFGLILAIQAAAPLLLFLVDVRGPLRILDFLPLAGFLLGLATALALEPVAQGAFISAAISLAGMGGYVGYCSLAVAPPVAWLVRRRGGRLTLDAVMLGIVLG